MTSGDPACAGDPLVATWAKPAQRQTWEIRDDCTWSLTQRESVDTGTWSRSDAKVTFVVDAPSGVPPTTVMPERVGDRLATPVVTAGSPVSAPPLVSSTIYPKLSGGDALAGTVWGADTQTPDQGGSCSYVEQSFRIMLNTDGTGTQTFRVACQPANMPFMQTSSGTWTEIENGAAFTFQITAPSDGGTQTWARFHAGFAIDFFARVP